MKVPTERIEIISPEDKFSVGDFNIRVYKGRHIDFDAEHIKNVFFKCVLNFPKFFYYAAMNSKMPEAEEIVLYEIENSGKRVLVMGSYGCDDSVTYPKDVDMFVMPFGGSPKIKNLAMPFIEAISPKCIMADHHDDAFPPLTRRMDAEGFEAVLSAKHPEIKYIVPDEYVSYVI